MFIVASLVFSRQQVATGDEACQQAEMMKDECGNDE
jgi:hypothetical protein